MSAALDTLFLPFALGNIVPPDGSVLFLRAQPGRAVDAFMRQHPHAPLICEQSFKPHADALVAANLELGDGTGKDYGLVLVLLPRQRMEARALLAEAVTRCAEGGCVVASAANNEGARSLEGDLATLLQSVISLSKHKCRVFWAHVLDDVLGHDVVANWRAEGEPHSVADFVSQPGVFAWDRVDAASQLLVEHLPSDLAGAGADLGCGWGFLSRWLLAHCAGIASLDLYEAESRALRLARINVPERVGVALRYLWHDVTAGLSGQYDFVVSNPPFHTGHADEPDLGREFIVSAAQALKPGGRFYLVANRHLPYEATIAQNFKSLRQVAAVRGFKVIEACK